MKGKSATKSIPAKDSAVKENPVTKKRMLKEIEKKKVLEKEIENAEASDSLDEEELRRPKKQKKVEITDDIATGKVSVKEA